MLIAVQVRKLRRLLTQIRLPGGMAHAMKQ
jgi:hypothetical protein